MKNKITSTSFRRDIELGHYLELHLAEEIPPMGYSPIEIINLLIDEHNNTVKFIRESGLYTKKCVKGTRLIKPIKL